jgi:hypothetical protein
MHDILMVTDVDNFGLDSVVHCIYVFCQECLPAAVQQYKSATGNDVSISIDTDNFLGNDV